MIALFVVMT